MKQQNAIRLDQLRADRDALRQLGSPILASQGMLVPRGMEHMRLFIKSCPKPIVSNDDPAQTFYAGGFVGITAGVPKTAYEGSVTIIETELGHVANFAEFIIASGGLIDCDFYDGRMDSFTQVYELSDCAFRFEPGEIDSESRSQSMTISAQLTYNFFGIHAGVGTNNTAIAGKKNLQGAEDLVSRVQDVLNIAQQANNVASSVVNVSSGIGRLFG